MYIRRKVFSKLQDVNGEERYFSTTEYTMDYDGEEIKYFAKTEEEDEKKAKRKKIAKKIAIGTGIAAGIGAAAYGGSKLTQRYISKKATALSDAIDSGKLDEGDTQKAYEQLGRLFRGERIAKKITNPVDATGRGVAKGAKAAYEGVKKAGKTVGDATVRAAKATGKGVKKGADVVAEAGKKASKAVKDTAEKVGEGVKKGAKNVKEKGKKVVDRVKNGKYTHPGWDSDDPE